MSVQNRVVNENIRRNHGQMTAPAAVVFDLSISLRALDELHNSKGKTSEGGSSVFRGVLFERRSDNSSFAR
jgi:hypothetical protein